MSPKLNRRGFVTAVLAAPVASAFTWPMPVPAAAELAPETRREAAGVFGSLGAAFCHYLAHGWTAEDCAALVQETSTPDAIAVVKAWLRDVERAL